MRRLKNPEDMLRFFILWLGICGSKISCFVDISCDVGQVFFCVFVLSSHKDSTAKKSIGYGRDFSFYGFGAHRV